VVAQETPRFFMGITVQEVTPDIARELGLSDFGGLIVTQGEPVSEADGGGIQRGDLPVPFVT